MEVEFASSASVTAPFRQSTVGRLDGREGGVNMKTSHRIKALRGVNELQDKVVEEVLEAYYFLRRQDENATIDATLAIVNEYKDMTSIYCSNCDRPNFCDDCFPMKKREIFDAIERILTDQRQNLPDIYKTAIK